MKRLFPLISVFCALICIQFCKGAATTAQNQNQPQFRTSAISENEPDVQSLGVPRGTEKKLRTSGYRSSRAGPLRRERPLCTSSSDRVEPIKRIHVAPVRITKNRKQDNLSTDASATDKPPRKVRYVYKRRRIANQADKPSDKPVKPEEAKVTTPAPVNSPAPEVPPVSGNKSEEVAEVEKKPEERRPVYKKKGSSTPPPPPASSTLNPEEFSEESNKDDLGDPSLFPKQNEEKSTTEEKNTQARGKGQAKSVLNNPSNLKPLNQQGSMETTEVGSVVNDKIGKVEVDKAAQEDKKLQRSEKRRKSRRTSARQQQRSTSSNEGLSRKRSNNDEGET